MNAAVICELNPFHKGHKRLFDIIKKSGENVTLTCVMSGNYVQRGETAIADKYERAKIAVINGADLVLELPLPYSLMSAEGFARGAVGIIERLGFIDKLYFGSESGDMNFLKMTAARLDGADFNEKLKTLIENNKKLTYGQAVSLAYREMFGDEIDSTRPNDLLACEYIRAVNRLNSKTEIEIVKREKEAESENDLFYSATKLRKAIIEKDGNALDLPFIKQLSENGNLFPITMKNNERGVLQLLRERAGTDYPFDNILNCGGISERIKSAVKASSDLETLYESLKSKDVSFSRIKRAVLCAYLEIDSTYKEHEPEYTSVLALNKKGAALLNRIRKKNSITIVNKPSTIKDSLNSQIKMNLNADKKFSLFYPTVQIEGLIYKKTPYYTE